MSPRFGSVITAMVTPFDDRGDLDLDAAVDLAVWLVANGSDGLVLSGTTGESPTLSESEELVLFRTIRGAVTVPILAGAGSNSTASAVEQTKRASELGVDGILSVTPITTDHPKLDSRRTLRPWPRQLICPWCSMTFQHGQVERLLPIRCCA